MQKPILSTSTPIKNIASDFMTEMNRLFEDFKHGLPLAHQAPFTSFDPACEIEEGDTHYFMSIDLPGVTKDDIKIQIVDNVLLISGQRRKKMSPLLVDKEMHFEDVYGFFKRSFTLPSAVDSDGIEAGFQDGVLEVFLPKSQNTSPREISIQEGHRYLRQSSETH